VLGDGLRGRHRVHRDVVEARRDGPLPQQHDGEVVLPVRDLVRGDGQRGEDEPVDHVRAHAVEHLALGGRVRAGGVQQHQVAQLGRVLGDLLAQLGEVGRVDLRHGEGQEAGAAVLQLAGAHVGAVPELADGLLDPGPGARLDVRVVVDDVGDGLDAHAGALGDVLEPGRHPVLLRAETRSV